MSGTTHCRHVPGDTCPAAPAAASTSPNQTCKNISKPVVNIFPCHLESWVEVVAVELEQGGVAAAPELQYSTVQYSTVHSTVGHLQRGHEGQRRDGLAHRAQRLVVGVLHLAAVLGLALSYEVLLAVLYILECSVLTLSVEMMVHSAPSFSSSRPGCRGHGLAWNWIILSWTRVSTRGYMDTWHAAPGPGRGTSGPCPSGGRRTCAAARSDHPPPAPPAACQPS